MKLKDKFTKNIRNSNTKKYGDYGYFISVILMLLYDLFFKDVSWSISLEFLYGMLAELQVVLIHFFANLLVILAIIILIFLFISFGNSECDKIDQDEEDEWMTFLLYRRARERRKKQDEEERKK